MEGLENHLIMVVEWKLNPISMHFRFLAINHNEHIVMGKIKGDIVCFGGCCC